MIAYCVTSNVTFPTGVVDCIYYSFNCCDTIFTIYAWFAVNAVSHFTKCYVVFNNTICINGSFSVVTVNEVQAFRQFNFLFSTAVSCVVKFSIAKVSCFCIYCVNVLTISTNCFINCYVVTSFNFCLSGFQLFYVNCVSIIYASFHVSDVQVTSIDATFSNGWTIVDYQTTVSDLSIANC